MNQIENNSHFDASQQRMNKIWEESKNSGAFHSIDVNGDWELVRARMQKNSVPATVRLPWHGVLLRIAAMVVMASAIGLAFFKVLTTQKTETVRQYTYEAGQAVGEFILPDGTVVTLNAGSTMTYQEGFDSDSRDVWLHGEGLFDVTPDHELPFRVYTGESMVEVTGTTFSISESEGMVKVAVLEGTVALSSVNAVNDQPVEKISIAQNQSGFLLSNNELVVRDGLEPNHLSWKTRRLIFEEAPLDSAFTDIAHYFRRDLQLESGLDVKITAEFENQPLSEILGELEQVTGLVFDTTGGSLIVRK